MGRRWPSSRTVVAVSGGCSWWMEPILVLFRVSQAPTFAYVRWTSSGELAGLASSRVPQKSRMYFIRSTSYFDDKRRAAEIDTAAVDFSPSSFVVRAEVHAHGIDRPGGAPRYRHPAHRHQPSRGEQPHRPADLCRARAGALRAGARRRAPGGGAVRDWSRLRTGPGPRRLRRGGRGGHLSLCHPAYGPPGPAGHDAPASV